MTIMTNAVVPVKNFTCVTVNWDDSANRPSESKGGLLVPLYIHILTPQRETSPLDFG